MNAKIKYVVYFTESDTCHTFPYESKKGLVNVVFEKQKQ